VCVAVCVCVCVCVCERESVILKIKLHNAAVYSVSEDTDFPANLPATWTTTAVHSN